MSNRSMIQLTENSLNSVSHWSIPIPLSDVPPVDWVQLFDQNGYDLTVLEQEYAKVNEPAKSHRYRYALKYPWMTWEKHSKSHFNHCLLFERKAYAGEALDQLLNWAEVNPLIWKVINRCWNARKNGCTYHFLLRASGRVTSLEWDPNSLKW